MKIEVLPNIECIPDDFQAVLLDAYGVFWGGNAFGLLPGAKEAMEKLVTKGKIIGVLSNTTALAAKEIAKFQRHGLKQGIHFHFVVTSGEVARNVFLDKKLSFDTPNNRFFLFGGIHPKFSSHEAIFNGTVYQETAYIQEADFIYISVPHIQGEDQLDAELFHSEIEKIMMHNLPMVCPNPDLFAHEGDPPRAVVRQGSIAKMYEELGGKVFYIGKPYEMSYMTAMEQFEQHKIIDPKQILMVGDTPETDIRGGRFFGMQTALVVKTGMMADRIVHHGLKKTVTDFSTQDIPDYFIEHV